MSTIRAHARSALFLERRDRLSAAAGPDVSWTVGEDQTPHPATTVLVAGRPTAEELDALPALTTLVVPYVGVPPKTMELVASRAELRLLHVHHNAQAVAEGALALLLAAARRVVPMHESLRSRDWTPRYRPDPALRMAGRRALLLGHGAIGQRLSPVLRALGMNVDLVRRRPDAGEFGPDDLAALLPTADVVLISLPSTSMTRGMLNRDLISLLPEHAVLVNVGRADVVDEEALFDALESKAIAAAALDVWWSYPPSAEDRRSWSPSEFPFHELENVVLSPHRTGHDDRVEDDRVDQVGELLRLLSLGDDVAEWEVDRRAGY